MTQDQIVTFAIHVEHEGQLRTVFFTNTFDLRDPESVMINERGGRDWILIANRLQMLVEDGRLRQVLALAAPPDLVLRQPLRSPIEVIDDAAAGALVKGGYVVLRIVVPQTEQERIQVRESLDRVFDRANKVDFGDGIGHAWVIITVHHAQGVGPLELAETLALVADAIDPTTRCFRAPQRPFRYIILASD